MAPAAGPDTRTTSLSGTRPSGWAPVSGSGDAPARGIRDDESDPPRVSFAHELQACGRVRVGRHHDVLQPLAETRFDRALVSAIDLDEVGDRSHLADDVRRFREDRPGAVAVLGARGVELLERVQPRQQRRELVLARAKLERACLAIGAGARELRFAVRALDAKIVHRRRPPGTDRPMRRRVRPPRAEPPRRGRDPRSPGRRSARPSALAPRSRAPWRGAAPWRHSPPRTPRCAPLRRLTPAPRSGAAPRRSVVSSAARVRAASSRSTAARAAASRRASSSTRAGSCRASSARTSVSIDAAAAASCSICCRSNAICCWSRPISSSLACAVSRAAVVCPSASISSRRSRSSDASSSATCAAAAVSRSRAVPAPYARPRSRGRASLYFSANCTFSQRRSSSRSRL